MEPTKKIIYIFNGPAIKTGEGGWGRVIKEKICF